MNQFTTSVSVSHICKATLSILLLSCVACGEAEDSFYGNNDSIHYAPIPTIQEPVPQDVERVFKENDFVETAEENTSTFSIDVDTASYTIMRRDIEAGWLPDPMSVRPEEYINYFDYDDAPPMDDLPFSIHLDVAPSYFVAEAESPKHLMRVGIQGKEISAAEMAPTNLVFLIDVSGSMISSKKLPLVQQSLNVLIDQLRPQDTVGIVVYAGDDRVVLSPTPASERATIQAAIDGLKNGGSTNAEAGIVTAYKMAEQVKKDGGNNRVLILTDGDFNVGRTGEPLFQLIDEYRKKEISLTCVGYGLGGYNDYQMENLSNRGNGNYFYVDTLDEAKRIFGSELPSTLEVIAADTKIQVEFDAQTVLRYRLIGYENRMLANKDFDDDTKDAGEIGAGHHVTAFYEIELQPEAERTALLSRVRVRYKSQYGQESKLIERAIKVANIKPSFKDAPSSFRFGAAVAEFAEILRGSKHSQGSQLQDVLTIASDAAGPTPDDKQAEFLKLVQMASSL